MISVKRRVVGNRDGEIRGRRSARDRDGGWRARGLKIVGIERDSKWNQRRQTRSDRACERARVFLHGGRQRERERAAVVVDDLNGRAGFQIPRADRGDDHAFRPIEEWIVEHRQRERDGGLAGGNRDGRGHGDFCRGFRGEREHEIRGGRGGEGNAAVDDPGSLGGLRGNVQRQRARWHGRGDEDVVDADAVGGDGEVIVLVETNLEVAAVRETARGERSVEIHGVLRVHAAQAAQRLHFVPVRAAIGADRHSVEIRASGGDRGRGRAIRILAVAVGPELQLHASPAREIHRERRFVACVGSAVGRLIHRHVPQPAVRPVQIGVDRVESCRAGDRPVFGPEYPAFKILREHRSQRARRLERGNLERIRVAAQRASRRAQDEPGARVGQAYIPRPLASHEGPGDGGIHWKIPPTGRLREAHGIRDDAIHVGPDRKEIRPDEHHATRADIATDDHGISPRLERDDAIGRGVAVDIRAGEWRGDTRVQRRVRVLR